mgnify:CR=1 FL=1
MEKVTIITLVYNPGKCIYRCVDSVLNQTFKNFKFVIVDNASSDGTKEILEEYAKKDSRICLLRNELNNVRVLHCIRNFVNTEYFMVVDHDDWLELNALELLYNMVEKEKVDIVFGRTDLRDVNEKLLETRGYFRTEIISSNELPEVFRVIYWQLRTLWGALIRTSLSEYIDEKTFKFLLPARYGCDTVMVLSMVFSASSIGFIKETIHNYRCHESSGSYSFCRERFMADWVLFDLAKQLLEKKNGFTPEN